MDSGKLAKLKEINWRPAPSCGGCALAEWPNGNNSAWGICTLKSNEYMHNKHKRIHPTPAHTNAVCDKFQSDFAHKDVETFLVSKVTS